MPAAPALPAALLAGLVLLALLCAPPARADDSAEVDRLGPGDSIRVQVFQSPELGTEARLSSQGAIVLPLAGPVELGGLTLAEAAGRIAAHYQAAHLLKAPQVNVSLLQMRSRQVAVLGQVARPGRYALDEGRLRLSDLIAQAGGIAPGGDETVTLITQRDGAPTRLSLNLAELYRDPRPGGDIELRSGDTVFVPRAPVFYIYGEVQRAGAYRLDARLNVLQALSLGGGITVRGTERGMKIHRRGGDGALQRLDARPADLVQPDDVIHVSESLF